MGRASSMVLYAVCVFETPPPTVWDDISLWCKSSAHLFLFYDYTSVRGKIINQPSVLSVWRRVWLLHLFLFTCRRLSSGLYLMFVMAELLVTFLRINAKHSQDAIHTIMVGAVKSAFVTFAAQ